MNTLHVRKGDTIIVLSGKDKGKKGKVLEVSPTEQKVIVEGVNKVKKHVKPRKQGEAGGIIEAEAPFYACKAQVVCPECGMPTRIAHQIGENGEKTRNCKHCGKNL